MWKHSILLMMSMALVLGGTAYGKYNPLSDSALIGWWACDEGQGSDVADSSPNGNNGTAYDGDLIWGPGVYGSAIELADPVLVEIPAINQALTECTMAGWIKRNGSQTDWSSFIMMRGTATGFNLVANQLAYHWSDTSASWSARPNTPIPDGEWTFCAVTVAPDVATFYINGVEMDTNVTTHGSVNWDANIYLGGDSTYTGSRRMTDAWLDDVSLFSRVLTAEEIVDIMGGLSDPVLAKIVSPLNETIDIPRDSDLIWGAGEGATSHDVYFGTSLADVEAGDASVLVSQGQSATTFDPGRLEFGQTYYWRIDENGGPEGTVTGEVWSFEVEPLAYPVENVTVTTNTTSDADAGPENMINGSGLNDAGQHSTNAADMWLGVPGADLPTIEFEFDQVYKLHEIAVWNYNVMFEPMLGFGLKDVSVEYSADGSDWVVLGDVQFAQATARADYEANTAVDFGGVAVKAVKLTVNSGYGPLGQFGLSEVRFMYVPASAREPQPADGATKVAPDAVLAWRAGREAAMHEVLVSASGEAVLDGTAVVDSISETTYPLAALGLEFGTTYYWKVNEVNEAEAISAWEGNIWSFAIEDYATIDDFESYTDDDGGRIYETWADGWVNDTGSTVGYLSAPFAEQSIVNGGRQSMPLAYDNSVAPFYSEAEYDLGGMNLGGNGADSLRLFVAGTAPSLYEGADGTIIMSAIGEDVWGTADQFRYVYRQLTGDGSMIARVDALDGAPSTWAKGGAMIRQSTEAGAINTFMAMTGGDGAGATYQQRMEADTDSVSQHTYDDGPFAPPYWVRVTREGNTLLGYTSPDGETWTQRGDTVTLAMADPVLIGLAVTSHNAAAATSAAFSNVSFTGNVTGSWESAEIGVAQPTGGNDIEPLYVALEDTSGNVAVVSHTSPTAVGISAWQEWLIPYTELGGINLNSVATVYVGVGDRDNPTAGGVGTVFVDDIGYGRPAPTPADITAAGDAVQGVPNDGDWPGAETPDLAIDDDVNTKFLHFKGETEPTGFQVTPAVGATVVTGLTLTTANDAPERDPIAFELYGSKDSIDGPYTLIASGDVVDFAGATAWERFTMTSTEISFENLMSYAHYQVLFPTVRDAGSANSMQIAEVELIGTIAP